MKRFYFLASLLTLALAAALPAPAQDLTSPYARIYDSDGKPINAANPLPVTGGGGGGGGGAVTVADGADVTQGAKADSVCSTAAGTCTMSALMKYLNTAATAAVPAGTNLIGKVGIDQTTQGTTNGVTNLPVASGGLSVKSILVANNTTSIAVDASPGQVYAISAYSISAATPVYLKFYNAAQGSTTCGSGTPVQREMTPAPGASGGGAVIPLAPGVAYSTAITICVTAGIADNDTTAPAATSYIVNVFYK